MESTRYKAFSGLVPVNLIALITPLEEPFSTSFSCGSVPELMNIVLLSASCLERYLLSLGRLI